MTPKAFYREMIGGLSRQLYAHDFEINVILKN